MVGWTRACERSRENNFQKVAPSWGQPGKTEDTRECLTSGADNHCHHPLNTSKPIKYAASFFAFRPPHSQYLFQNVHFLCV